jgi:hypothetical protein
MEPLRTLRQCLVDLELPRLRVIARLWGLELQATRPLDIAAELAQAMTDPANAADAWQTLPADQRAALAALLGADGWMAAATFRRRFGEIRPIGPGRLEQETPWRDPISPAEGLWYGGFIFEGFAGEPGLVYPMLFIPAELRAVLPVEAGTLSARLRIVSVAPPAVMRSAGDEFLNDAVTTLAFIHNQTVRSRSVSAWSEPALRALTQQLRDPDSERLVFLLHLLDHLGWVRLGEHGRLRLAAEPVTAWLQATSQESQAVLIQAWREMMAWNELWRLPSLQPDDTGAWRNDPTLARAALLRHLAALPVGEWFSIADFIAAVKAADPDFQRPDGDYGTWYIRDAASGEYLTGFESWDQVEGALLRALLTGPAFWLGLVELSADGAVFCPVGEPADTETPPPPTVHPDLSIEIPAARRFQRFQLARIADLQTAGESYVYRLTPASLARARQQRISFERLLGFLDELSETPLPGPVRACLTRWFERGTELWLERVVLLRVSSQDVLKQILDAPQTRRYVQRVIGPTAAAVAEEDWQRLVEALAEIGLLAEMEGLTEIGKS